MTRPWHRAATITPCLRQRTRGALASRTPRSRAEIQRLATDDDPHQRHNAVTVAGTDHTGHEHAPPPAEPPPRSRLLHRRSRHPRPPFQRARTHVPIRSCSAPRLPPGSKSSDNSEPRNQAGCDREPTPTPPTEAAEERDMARLLRFADERTSWWFRRVNPATSAIQRRSVG